MSTTQPIQLQSKLNDLKKEYKDGLLPLTVYEDLCRKAIESYNNNNNNQIIRNETYTAINLGMLCYPKFTLIVYLFFLYVLMLSS